MSGSEREADGLPAHVRLETEIGSLLLPADDAVMTPWIREYGSWEVRESAALRALIRPGSRVLDVGAHVGYLTLLAAAATGPTGRVVAVEPEPSNHALLCANLAAHRADHVDAVAAAAWREAGELTMTLSEDNSGDHRPFARASGGSTVTVPAVRLDDLAEAQDGFDVVKVDIQGCDHVAIAGLERTIARGAPVMLVEFWPAGIAEFGDAPADVLSYYRDLGFHVGVLEAPALGASAPADQIVETAEGCPGGFCTLILHPRG